MQRPVEGYFVKNQCAGVDRHKNIARAFTSGVAILVTMAIMSLPALGCGESASSLHLLSAGPTQSVATTTTTQTTIAYTATTLSIHQMIMIEQGLATGTGASYRRIKTAATGTPQPAEMAAASTPESAASNDASAVPNGPTAVVLAGGRTPLRGIWSGTAERLASYLLGTSPSPDFTVPPSVLAEYYVYYCAEVGLRADLLWAQMIHETGYGMYGGDVRPEQNNYAGLGAIGGNEPGASFQTAEAGVIAHVAHMVAYVYASSPVSWANAATDPRFDFVNPRGGAFVLADLNGRWAVPGTTYGQSIEGIARAINSY